MGAKDSKPKDMKQIVKETKVTEKEIKQYYKDFKQVILYERIKHLLAHISNFLNTIARFSYSNI